MASFGRCDVKHSVWTHGRTQQQRKWPNENTQNEKLLSELTVIWSRQIKFSTNVIQQWAERCRQRSYIRTFSLFEAVDTTELLMAQTEGRVTQRVCQEFRHFLTANFDVNLNLNHANVNAPLLCGFFWYSCSGCSSIKFKDAGLLTVRSPVQTPDRLRNVGGKCFETFSFRHHNTLDPHLLQQSWSVANVFLKTLWGVLKS